MVVRWSIPLRSMEAAAAVVGAVRLHLLVVEEGAEELKGLLNVLEVVAAEAVVEAVVEVHRL